jgi:hypothetical protein
VVAITDNVPGLSGNDKWHLATGPDPITANQQNVYIAWTQNVPEDAGLDQRIVVSGSTDGGASFSTPVIINDPSIAGTRNSNLFADPAVGLLGEVYVAWHEINAGKVFVDVSLDGGVTFGTDNLVTTSGTGFKTSIPPQPDRGVHVGPTIDADRSDGPFGGRLYVTYVDLGVGGLPNTDIFVRSSDDDGATWSAPTLVNDDGGTNSQFLPWLDIDQQTGVVSTVWYDARNDGTNNEKVEIFIGVSANGGVTFQPNILVSDGQSDQSTNNANRTTNNYLEYIGIAALNCTGYPVWSDNSNDLADLDYFTDQVSLDATPPQVFCNTPANIIPPDAPISFTATATDTCDASPDVVVTGFDCFKFTKKGKRIDKTESCQVSISGDSVTINDSGGVNDTIEWTVEATDGSGNMSTTTCLVLVVKP